MPLRARARALLAAPAPILLVLALIVLILLSSPVRAQESDDGPPPRWDPVVTDAALADLFLEIAVLHELDAFATPRPDEFGAIHAAYGPWASTATRAEVVAFLFAVDARLADRADEVAATVPNPASLQKPLAEIPAVERAGISRNDRGVVPVGPYLAALHDLLTSGDARRLQELGELGAVVDDLLPMALAGLTHPSDIDGLRLGTDALAARPVDQPTPREPAGAGESDDGFPWRVVLGISVVALVTGAATAVVRTRRRSRRPDEDAVSARIWEAHRRMSGCLDESGIATVATDAATAITDSVDALVFRVTDGGLRQAGEGTIITRSALLRIAETAQPLLAVLDEDPAVGSAAVCAVPLAADATMTGVLVTRREADRPFDHDDRHRLELLAPVVAGALSAADRLGSYVDMAMVDGLTALGNRRRLDHDLDAALAKAATDDMPVAFAMIDVDHFKEFNDTHGHEAGDVALQTVARIIEGTTRATDVVYRYGGEEFSVLLPGATVDEARAAGERMRAAVEQASIPGGDTQPGGRLTISVGVSTLDSGSAEGLKRRADEALYRAKAEGRNRSVLA